MDRKTDSKSNLNESTVPLLDDVNKEKIELKSKTAAESESKTESTADATDKGTTDNAAKDAEEAKKKKEEEKERKRKQKLEEEEKKKQQKLEKQKKKEEEKELKRKEKEEKKAALEAAKAANGTVSGQENAGSNKNWCAYNQFTFGINLLDRDERSINQHVNVNFEDVIGEPDAAQGFEGAYRLSYGVFQFVRFWVYRILMTILSVPFALLWALVFAFLSLMSVWVLTPSFRVLDIVYYFFHRFWNATVRTVLDPVFSSVALLRQSPVSQFHQTPVATFSGRTICRNGVNYNQLATDEVTATFKKSDSDDEVTEKQVSLNIDNV